MLATEGKWERERMSWGGGETRVCDTDSVSSLQFRLYPSVFYQYKYELAVGRKQYLMRETGMNWSVTGETRRSNDDVGLGTVSGTLKNKRSQANRMLFFFKRNTLYDFIYWLNRM